MARTAERDEQTPPFHAEIILRGVADPRRVSHRCIAGASHYAFLTPFPPAMRRPGFVPAQDPEGFDRAALHRTLDDEIATFLRENLK
jgi:hypothetical protein